MVSIASGRTAAAAGSNRLSAAGDSPAPAPARLRAKVVRPPTAARSGAGRSSRLE